MKTRTGIDVCYNAQISVDDKYHLIVDYDLDNDPTDCSSMVQEGRRMTLKIFSNFTYGDISTA